MTKIKGTICFSLRISASFDRHIIGFNKYQLSQIDPRDVLSRTAVDAECELIR